MNYVALTDKEEVPSLLNITENGINYTCRFRHADSNYEAVNKKRKRKLLSHRHNFFHILVFTDGKHEFNFADKAHTAERGVLVLAGSNIPHFFYPLCEGKITYCEVTFSYQSEQDELAMSFSRLAGLISGINLPELEMPVKISERETSNIVSYVESIIVNLNAGSPAARFHAYTVLVELFGYLIDNIYAEGIESDYQKNIPVELWEARTFIEKYYMKKLSLTKLAEKAHLDSDYFCKKFKKHFNISPIAYQQQLRIQAAINLLITTDLRCKEIAAKVGFYDEYSFSKFFKKTEGIPPGEYRRGELY